MRRSIEIARCVGSTAPRRGGGATAAVAKRIRDFKLIVGIFCKAGEQAIHNTSYKNTPQRFNSCSPSCVSANKESLFTHDLSPHKHQEFPFSWTMFGGFASRFCVELETTIMISVAVMQRRWPLFDRWQLIHGRIPTARITCTNQTHARLYLDTGTVLAALPSCKQRTVPYQRFPTADWGAERQKSSVRFCPGRFCTWDLSLSMADIFRTAPWTRPTCHCEQKPWIKHSEVAAIHKSNSREKNRFYVIMESQFCGRIFDAQKTRNRLLDWGPGYSTFRIVITSH